MLAQSFILPKLLSRDRAIERVATVLRSLDPAKAWRITIALYKRSRSDQQNNALWGVAYKTLRQETGNDAKTLHRHFCEQYFGKVEISIGGVVHTKPRRTTTTDEHGNRDVISTTDFMDFYAFVQQWSAEHLSVYVPDPNEVTQ